MANSGNFKSVLISFATMTGLLALCTPAGAESAVPMQRPLQLLEAVDSRDEKAAVRLVADAVSLQALALHIETISSIDVVIAPGLSQTVVNVRVASPNWDTALQQLFSSYSTVVGWNQQGRVRSFYVLASAARDNSPKAVTGEPAPATTMPASNPPVIAELGTHSTSVAQTVPDYTLHTEEADILELMRVDQGSDSKTIELLPAPQHRPEIKDLLQRMRAVETPMDNARINRQLAIDSDTQAGSAMQAP